jgi:hypothetical protein
VEDTHQLQTEAIAAVALAQAAVRRLKQITPGERYGRLVEALADVKGELSEDYEESWAEVLTALHAAPRSEEVYPASVLAALLGR